MKIVAYYRVSTKRQGRSGLGLEAQKTAVESFADTKNANIVEAFTEVESGRRRDRNELNKALSLAKREKAWLVIAKLDRLARNFAFLDTLSRSKAEFIALDCPHANKTMLQMMMVMAEWEADQISARTKAALAAVKQRGVKLGSARPGHWKGREDKRQAGLKKASRASIQSKRKAAAEAYSDLMPRILEWRESGWSFRRIADGLNKNGRRTRRDKPWNPMQVRRVMQFAPSSN